MQPAEDEAIKLRQRNHELSVLNTIAGALNRSVELDEALRVTLAQVAELLELRTGWIWLMRADGRPYLAASLNLPPGLAQFPQRMEGWCYCLETFRDGDLEGAANVNVISCSRLRALLSGTGGLRYHASIPLYGREGQQLGVLNVASPDWRKLSPDDLRLLHTVGDLLGIAVERAQLFAYRAQMGAVAERNRLAREIHDTLAQGLAGIALQIESAEVLLEGEARAQAQAALHRALNLARAGLEEARRSVLDLRGVPLEGRSLAEALRALARDVAANGGPRITCRFLGATIPVPQRIELGLYRIAQEGLTNIARHAHAQNAVLSLRVTAQQALLTLRDDGQGFDPTSIPDGRFGLVGMAERARLLGGTLRIGSAPGQGTRVEARIPLEGAA